MVNCRRELGESVMKLIWCNGFPDIYAQLGVLICYGYMCTVPYMKLIWCNGFQRTMLDWREEGVNLPWVYMHCSIYIDVPSLV